MTLSNGCHLVTLDGRQLPLRSVALTTHAAGGLASVRLRQTFANPHAEPLAVTYQLPLPADAAVVDFRFVLDGRVIAGVVQKKADARETFERAVLEGRTAALLEQERSSLFTQRLGNLPAGAVLQVEIDVEQPLAWRDQGWEWRFPTVIAPRYLGDATPDAAAVTVGVTEANPSIPCTTTLSFDGELATSPSHGLRQQPGSVELTGTLDRDVVVRWKAVADHVGTRLETCEVDGERLGLLTVVPPAVPSTPVPRDVLLLLDTSGSMGGAPLAQLQAFSKAIVAGLSPDDQLEMIEFSNRPSRWRKAPVRMAEGTRQDAARWLEGLRASGGTQMHEAVMAATSTLRAEATRQVVLVTDGLIGFESQILGHLMRELPPGCRFHTIGIGHAPNRTLTGGVARAGGGFEAIVAPDEPVGPVVTELLTRLETPQITGWRIEGARVLAPSRLPDLMAGAPTRVSLALTGGPVVVRGHTASGEWTAEVQPEPTGRRVVATRFARERVADLELEASAGTPVDPQIEALGLRHRIATRLTSWVATTSEKTVDPGAPTRHEDIPQALPAGMSAEGVGLRTPPRFQGLGSALPAPAPMLEESFAAMAPPLPRGGGRPTGRPRRMSLQDAAGAKRSIKKGKKERRAKAEEPKPWIRRAKEALGIARKVVRARLRQVGKRWVIEVDGPLQWDASGELAITLSSGQVVRQPASEGTTAPGPIAPGATARLVLELPEAPVRVTLGALELEL